MKEMKRLLALFLCFVMLAGSVPVSALAEETEPAATEEVVVEPVDEDTVVIEPEDPEPEETESEGTESEETETEEIESEETETEETESEENVQTDDGVLQILMGADYAGDMSAVMAQVQAAYSDIDEMLFLGNYSDAEALLTEAQGYYTLDNEVVLVQGDQDAMSDLLAWSGNHDTNSYGAFVINEEEYVNGIDQILIILEAYLGNKEASGFAKPIFVLSNRGLHYGSGNEAAGEVFALLNKAAEAGLTIVYVYGDAEDTYVGDGAVYLGAGSTIKIAESETYAEKTLAFTYLNAGATSENMTVFTFVEGGAEDVVSVSRYDASGLCLLKNAGIEDALMVADTTTVNSPAAIKVTAPENTVVEGDSGTFDVPTGQAESGATIVIAASDYQNTNGGLFSSGAATDAYAIMDRINDDYPSAYGFLFGGDYYAHNTYTTTDSTNGKNQLKGEIVDVLYPEMADDTQIYVQGNHDHASLVGNVLTKSGANDTEEYGVFVINEKDYNWGQANGNVQNQSAVKAIAEELTTYMKGKLTAKYEKPIFVISHLPLHYSTRTSGQGDGMYAKYIYDVLQEAGECGLNIIFLFGHNHSTPYDAYLGNASIYLPEGSSIAIANEGSKTSYFTDKLAFTYMNAGYVGYVGAAGDNTLTMTVFEITDNQVAVKRYDENGLHNLKAAGTTANLPSGLSADTTVIGTAGATIALTTPEEKTTLTDNGVTVTAADITAVTASKEEDPTYNASLYSGYEVYNVAATGYETGKTAFVTIALTDGDFDTTRAVTVTFPNGHTEEVAVTNGSVTIETDELGAFTLTQKVQTEIEIPGSSGSGDTGNGTIWRRVTSFTAGKKYMLVNYGDNASGVGTHAINSTAGGTAVTVQTDSTGAYIENSNMALAWTYNSNAELTNADTNQYLYIADYPSGTSGVALDVTNSVTTGSSYSSWKLATNTGVNEVSLSAYRNGSSNYYPARWSNGGAEYLAYTSTQTSKHDNWIAIFEQTSEGGSSSGGSDAPTVDTTGGSWVTITEPTGGTTTYTYTQATSITAGEKYVIVGNDDAIALMDNNGDMDTQTVTINGTTMTSTTALTEWTFSGSSSGTIYNGTRYLRYSTSGWSGSFNLSTSSSNLTFTDNGSNFRIYNNASYGTDYSFYYDGSSWTRSSSTQYVRLYQLTDTTTTGGTGGLYGKLDGELTYTVPYGTSEAVALQKVKDGIAIKYAYQSDYSDEATFPDDGAGMTWVPVNYDPETPGEYAVNISYNGTLLGTAKIKVNEKPAGTAQVTLDSDSGIVRQNAGPAALTGNKLTVTYDDGTTETVNVTVAMVKKADGTAVDTSVPGIHPGLKVVYTYNGVEYTICDNYTLTVRENVQNNYPEYPDEGAVKVNKTGTGIDFQSSGIAQVELSASGIPSKKGVDVIVMVDTSSSMKRGAGTNSEVSAPNRRIDFLQVALANLIREFQAVGEDGEQLDVNVAIAEFNGYDFINNEDEPSDSEQQGASNVAEVFTGDRSKTAGAFVQATTITNPDAFAANIGHHSGTNYDYAFDTVYRLGSAINTQNEANGVERDLFVIFMSDGAPYGYNYYGSGTTDTWDDYLNGSMTLNSAGNIVDDTGVYLKGNTHFYRTDGKHWMAEAIKGTTDQTYMVIDPSDSLGTDATAANVKVYEDAGIILTEGKTDYFRMVPGLGAEMHTIGFCLYDDNQGGVNNVTATTQKALMQRLASVDAHGNTLYHETDSGSDLNDIFCDIASRIAYAATNARMVDQMGDDYNLQLKTSTYKVVENGEEVVKTLAPVIEIGTYTIYTRQDYLNGKCTESQIGDRTGSFKLTEVVVFSEDGTKAYSNLIDVDGDGTFGVTVNTDGTYTINDTADNIFGTDGVIYAKNFLYNNNPTDVAITNVDIPTGKTSAGLTYGSTTTVPSETFYWKLGTIQTSELAMRYYVYLEGSMEGTREAGSYPTNEYATLYYDNYLGKPCYKDTVSPVMAWKEANVSYAFYLVNKNGEIIVNQTTGATGTFANKIAVTNPVVYQTVLLNNDGSIQAIRVADVENSILPLGYELYDRGAEYRVEIKSNSAGSWTITNGGTTVNSTYVTQYKTDDASAYSNELSVDTLGNDYTHTIVWFAVLWEVQALPDTVVIDYGLPVDISVLTNDMFGEAGKLAGIGAYSESLNLDGRDETLASGFGETYEGTYGDAKADTSTGKVRYTLGTMEMNGYEKFAYAVNYTGTANSGYYYDTITVIPATTIYYEDSFLTFKKYTETTNEDGTKTSVENGTWETDGTAVKDAVQAEDRPGAYSLTDANNIYGYDAVNNGMSTHSLGQARKVHVDATSYATASFEFYGTGFDVISMTSNTTGTIAVAVKDSTGASVARKVVNTYYGYSCEEREIEYTYVNGKWVDEDKGAATESTQVSAKPESPVEGATYTAKEYRWVAKPDTANALYQIPVLQIEGLAYGKYTVTITATYVAPYDATTADGYDLYLDAIRIYDPANDGASDGTTDTTIEDAYTADGEGWPSYLELRNKIIPANSFDDVANEKLTEDMEGLVFIDGDASVGDAQIEDYVGYGPNNEIYLAPGQRVAFMLTVPANIDNVHIGIRSANNATATYTIANIAKNDVIENETVKVEAGSYYNPKTATINTATDMYYDMTAWRNDIIVISNTGDRYGTTGILSLTNIKSTYTSNPDASGATVASLDEGIAVASVEDEIGGETGIYMTPAAATLTLRSLNRSAVVEPEETVPETTVPETTVPETTVPEETVPETTVPEVTEPEATEPEEDATQMETVVQNIINTVTNILKNLFGSWFR